MIRWVRAQVVVLLLWVTGTAALAGFNEGLVAYNKGDFSTAFREWKPLALQGDKRAQSKLGDMYFNGKGVTQDFQDAAKWYRMAAEEGDANAQYNLGTMYAFDLGVTRDLKEAVTWLRLAAEQGLADAQNDLGVMYDKGSGVPQDFKEAAKWYLMAAKQGNGGAQYNLSMMLYNGRQGVPQDFNEAAKWYRMAAEQGNSNAQHSLGFMYFNGQGVPQDFKEAVKWFRMAAEKGNANAQYNLGFLYASGHGAPQDFKEAVKWYRLAAERGNAFAQNNLGGMYANGSGVALSKVIGYALYNLSAANDPSPNNKATSNRADLATKMLNADIEIAQGLTREMQKPMNFLAAIELHERQTASSARPTHEPSTAQSEQAATATADEFPAPPAKRPGVVSCNTRCVNAACWRTYDDGRKFRFQAKRVWDPISNQFKFDSGGC